MFRRHHIAYLLAVLLGMLSTTACKEDSAETKIRKVILASVEAANERALGRMMEHVSDSFIGPYGMDKKDAQRYIFAKLYRNEWRRVLIYKLKVELESPTTAKASFKIFLARSDEIKSLEDIKTKTKLDAFRLEVDLVSEDESWRVIKAKHRRLGPKELL